MQQKQEYKNIYHIFEMKLICKWMVEITITKILQEKTQNRLSISVSIQITSF